MLTLYHCHNARSFRPLWTLEEMGLSYELKMLPFPPRDLAPDYLGVNPLGTVPTFLDGSMRMTKSAAICQYLVTRYGPSSLAVNSAEPDFGPYLNWLYFGEATLTFPLAVVLRYSVFAPPERRLDEVAADYSRWFLTRLRGIDAVVSKQPTIGTVHCGRHFRRLCFVARGVHKAGREVHAGGRRLLDVAQRA